MDFKWYLHDSGCRGEMVESLVDKLVPEADAERIAEARPFYEIELDCSFDSETRVLLVKMKPMVFKIP